MVKNKVLVLSTIIIIATLAYLVIAASGDDMKILSPLSGTNFTSISSVLFNVSFVNGTDITQPNNVSFFFNISGQWTQIGNATCQTKLTESSCGALIINSTIPEGVYSLNATIYNDSTSISVIHSTNLSTLIYIDATRPIVFSENITRPLSWGNYSQNLILNTSAIDVTLGIRTIFFNITNSTDNQNATITLIKEGTANTYSTTINTTHYPDGYYNLTIYANDTLNLNNSAKVYRIIFDNTKPTVTHSCNDYTVEEDDVITCTCSGTDALSGMDASHGVNGASYTASPSTANTGNNQQTICTTKDLAGNTNTSTLYYNVTSASSSSTSSGGSSRRTSSSGNSTNSTNNNSNSTETNSTNSNSSTTNTGVGEGNLLAGNQNNQETKLKISVFWTVIIFVAIGIIIVIIVFRKYIKTKLANLFSKFHK